MVLAFMEEISTNEPTFGNAERLALHQLRILEWQSDRENKTSEFRPDAGAAAPAVIPEKWMLTQGLDLYDWQKECVEKWFAEGGRGTIKVVTGGGKTLLALAIAEALQNRKEPDLHLAVTVPTIVLMHQWYDELVEKGNIPKECIGRLGGGYQEEFDDQRRIMLCVLVSASKKLPQMVEKRGVGDRLLLAVDECHRAGSADMSRVLETHRAYSLGLSATPERDDEADADAEAKGYEDTVVGKALGKIIFELSYADALSHGLIPPFTVHHFGLPLTPAEKTKYEQLTRSISDARSELKANAPMNAVSGGSFFRWARSMAAKRGGELGGLAAKMVGDSNRRKELLYRMDARTSAVVELLRKEFAANPDARVILFHESIVEAMRLFVRLRDEGFSAIAEHSELPDSVRENGLDLFRKGIAQVLVSVKSLIEGFNVPAVDVGIIVASSSSVRQRVQSMGRVLRRHRTKDGEEKTSCIHVLYGQNTVDDAIYEKLDWERATGLDRNLYYLWTPGEEPVSQPGPPKSPLPGEDEIDLETLQSGDVYPGRYEGEEFSCDTSLGIRNADGAYAKNATDLAAKIIEVKGQAGRFRITPKCNAVLVRVSRDDEWETLLVSKLDSPLQMQDPNDTGAEEADEEEWLASAKPGDLYPFKADLLTEKWTYRQKRGGIITRKIANGEAYARIGRDATNPEKGNDAEKLLASIQSLTSGGRTVTHLERTATGHILFREAGLLHFITVLTAGLEFPE
jgi:superfamily II DNA or RNA helicase